MVVGHASSTQADLITYDDKATFLTETGATSASGPLPALDIGNHGSITVGSVELFIDRFRINDSTPLLPGLETRISSSVNGSPNESIDVAFDNPVMSAGFDFVEPSTGVDSTFEVTLKLDDTEVDSFTFNAADDTAAFVGAWSDAVFDVLEIRETVGAAENEYYGEFYSGTISQTAIPEPTTFAAVLALSGIAVFRRRTG